MTGHARVAQVAIYQAYRLIEVLTERKRAIDDGCCFALAAHCAGKNNVRCPHLIAACLQPGGDFPEMFGRGLRHKSVFLELSLVA